MPTASPWATDTRANAPTASPWATDTRANALTASPWATDTRANAPTASPWATDTRANADEIEATRRVPDALDARLGEAGLYQLYQLYLPEAYGGRRRPLVATQAIEEIAKATGPRAGSVCSARC